MNNRISGIYFLYYRDVVVYVGLSINILLRIEWHFCYDRIFDRFEYVRTRVNPQSTKQEKRLIKKYRPKYNVNNNPRYPNGKNKYFYRKTDPALLKHRPTLKELLHNPTELPSTYLRPSANGHRARIE